MAEMSTNAPARQVKTRHRGRIGQVYIYLGKMLRMFVYQNDWKVLPMAALIAGLVGMVISNRQFINMEGTLMGSFALVMVCIWNGCFNSIQVICRERDVIKREHRSGMHISSYIVAHMIYQALLCLLQTGVTLYVIMTVGVKFPAEGMFTRWFIVDFCISMFLITYASDMLSLWISTIARTTTTAMTIMPFVMIFQLVFSGGMLALPDWTSYITPLTISNPALKVICAQSDYNSLPMKTIWDQVDKMRDKEVTATLTLRQVVEKLQDEENPAVATVRDTRISRVFTLGEARDMVEGTATWQAVTNEPLPEQLTLRNALKLVQDDDTFKSFREYNLGLPGFTVGNLIDDLMASGKLDDMLDKPLAGYSTIGEVLNAIHFDELLDQYSDTQLGMDLTLGEAVDMLASNPDVQARLDQPYTLKANMGDIINMIGEDKVEDLLKNKVAKASTIADYDCTMENILDYWTSLFLFILAFAALSIITLEFIDKDKR